MRTSNSKLSPESRHCIEQCTHCHQVCLQHAARHCLELGGEHVEPEHFRLMLACAEICRTTAAILSIGVPQHARVCAACAAICTACADSCTSMKDMEDCARACRDCAASCSDMAGPMAHAA